MPGQPWLWAWTMLAAVLALAELATPGLFVLPWGVGAAVAAVAGWLGAGPGAQTVTFIVVSSASFVGMQRWKRGRYVGRHRKTRK